MLHGGWKSELGMRRILVYNSTCVRGTFGVEDGRLAQRPLRAQEALPEVSENLRMETEGVRTRENGFLGLPIQHIAKVISDKLSQNALK